MKNILTILTLIIGVYLVSACSNAANQNANSNSSNKAVNSSSNAGNTDSSSTKPPVTLSITDIALGSDFYEVTDKYKDTPLILTGYLNYIKNEAVGVSTSKGTGLALYGVSCKGDFAKYSNIMKTVEDLAKELKAPEATIRGIVKEIKDDVLILEPCVLVDIKK